MSPFPGMDPFLEVSSLFPDVHRLMIAGLFRELAEKLPPRYYASSETRVWIEPAGRSVLPDVHVVRGRDVGGVDVSSRETEYGGVVLEIPVEEIEYREPLIEIHDLEQGDRLVTVIEVLSPANKASGSFGRSQYLQKRQELALTGAHIVEIDLLRGGAATTAVPPDILRDQSPEMSYHIRVGRSDRPGKRYVYPVRLKDSLPVIEIPLSGDDPPVAVDLQAVFREGYRLARFGSRVDYRGAVPGPPLSKSDEQFVEECLSKRTEGG